MGKLAVLLLLIGALAACSVKLVRLLPGFTKQVFRVASTDFAGSSRRHQFRDAAADMVHVGIIEIARIQQNRTRVDIVCPDIDGRIPCC